MDPKDVRRILDEVCADLDRRKARASLLGRYARPVGLSVALGLGGVAGCGSDSLSTGTDAAPDVRDGGVDLPQSKDLYGATVDLLPVGPEVTPSPFDGAAELYGAADRPLIDAAVDIYAAADRPLLDAPLDGFSDLYGLAADRPILEAAADIYAATDRGVDKPAIDSQAIDSQAVDGDKID